MRPGAAALFIISASDGVWDVFGNDEAVHWVTAYVTRTWPPGAVIKPAAKSLAEEAQRRWVERDQGQCIVDDTSVIITFFVPPESLQQFPRPAQQFPEPCMSTCHPSTLTCPV